MKGCMVCNVKYNSFYVSKDEAYLCPKHRNMLFDENAEKALEFKKNKFVPIDEHTAEMSVYNKSYKEKPDKILVDIEDILILQEVRWKQHGDGFVNTTVSRLDGRKLTVNLLDYIMYMREGIEQPSYHGNQNKSDCRKINIRRKRDERNKKSTIKNLIYDEDDLEFFKEKGRLRR